MNDERFDASVEDFACVEKQLDAFEVAWHGPQPPSLVDHVSDSKPNDTAVQRTCIFELIAIDLEHRWRAGDLIPADDAVGRRPKLQSYLTQLPKLGPVAQLPGWLVAEEYRVRHLWGDAPNKDRFIVEYPDHLSKLVALLRKVEGELMADGAMAKPKATFSLAVEADPRAPLLFADYVLEEHLGTGAMGKVYRATQRSLQRSVAIKALLKSRQQNHHAIEQFLHEARLLGRLNHPNIVKIHGLGRFPNSGFFFAMQLVDGQDLAEKLKSASLPIVEAVDIMCAVADAIQHAHENGVIHCDLKPANVLSAKNGQVFVSDFGFGQLIKGTTETMISVGGTIGFMAPEQIDPAAGEMTSAVDIYGLGALFYTLMTSQPPYQIGLDASASDQKEATVIPAGELRTDIPAKLEAICMKCLSLQPADRFASVADFASELRAWAER